MKVCVACAAAGYGECTHYREGKTKREKASGVWSNRFANRAQRASWLKEPTPTNATFPKSSCNGKRNRFFK